MVGSVKYRLVCMYVCLFVCHTIYAKTIHLIFTKLFLNFLLWPQTWTLKYLVSIFKVKVTKKCWNRHFSYLLTWADFQKFISPSIGAVSTWNFMDRWRAAICVTWTNMGQIRFGFDPESGFFFNIESPIYDGFLAITRANFNFLTCNFLVWQNVLNYIILQSFGRIRMRSRTPEGIFLWKKGPFQLLATDKVLNLKSWHFGTR